MSALTVIAPGRRCQCDPCTLPRAHGGRCPSTDTTVGEGTTQVTTSSCLACAFCCDDEATQ